MTKKVFNFRVTDHVLLRYMERMLGVDVDAFRERLKTNLVPYAASGAASVEISGMVFKFTYGTHDTVCATMWPSNHIEAKKRPPLSGDESGEAKHIIRRKRTGK